MQNIMRQVNLNMEAKRLIEEKISELNTDFDNKISDKQKVIQKKVDEIEESMKPGKKK